MRLVGSARIVVVPIYSPLVSAGQLTMMEAMALGRPLVVSVNMATVEHARHLESAVFFEAGDSEGLNLCLRLLLDHPDFAERLAKKGRETARLLPARRVQVLMDFLGDTFRP
jgi:glycosyltransferase involved in cell wall biosynthesis